ncbi:ribonuclease Z [Algibacter amylolyticus]|uniref:Ribonuclease Z n=1 Tax=Algibacter amylolyticus TaxID=1608400 RepID=A0A5M7B0X6_9FLAO|nr:ribonuclease Z [Algibacter amylolyticus]KAA5821134.1 ribonuclease Z [Algibacter amylolyticus]MBB5269779.1 signal recognition particle receptor subunit beta [Algibacter amylolyticus]TSJ72080.1 ribonuclease Z [Algibacter amylolyticus]
MIFDQDGNTVIITQEKVSLIELVKKLQTLYPKYKNNNIIVALTSLDKLTKDDIVEFLDLSNTHKAAKHSFVIVSNKIDIDTVPDELVVVPTILEAHDIIEMEVMERDLGL